MFDRAFSLDLDWMTWRLECSELSVDDRADLERNAA